VKCSTSRAQIDALEKAGMSSGEIQHACTVSYSTLNRMPDQIAAVADYVKSRGVSTPGSFLFCNPKLLEYDPEGEELVKLPRARARIDLGTTEDGEDTVLISWYSKNAAFNTAPIAPWTPQSTESTV
jgi:hypothetical protein